MKETDQDRQSLALWPEDFDGQASTEPGPDTQLAVALLAAGCAQHYVRTKCGFESRRQCEEFCRDDETRQAVAAMVRERSVRLGKRAMVSLERIVSGTHTDLRAHVLAIRTALEVAGDLKRDHAAPVKSVRELSVPELSELIAATRSELEARITRQQSRSKAIE